MHHPCQAAADMMTIVENSDKMNGHVAWVGDGNNVLHDLMLGCAILGYDIVFATPQGFEPNKSVISRTLEIAKKTGSKIKELLIPKWLLVAQYTPTCLFPWEKSIWMERWGHSMVSGKRRIGLGC